MTSAATRVECAATAVEAASESTTASMESTTASVEAAGMAKTSAAKDTAATARAAAPGLPELIKFVPLDPAKKMSEAAVIDARGVAGCVVKGAFREVVSLTPPSPGASNEATELEGRGFRVLAVAAGRLHAMKPAGLIALSDPPRPDAAALIAELRALGVRTLMVTGDAPRSVATVARALELDGLVARPGPIRENVRPQDFAVFPGVLPAEKCDLVVAFQCKGYIVGMCGDGPNDAAALRQAQMGSPFPRRPMSRKVLPASCSPKQGSAASSRPSAKAG